MSDVYQAPVSDLEVISGKYKPSFGWKLLFVILLPLELWSQYDAFSVNELNEPFWLLLTSLGIYTVYYIGLFGLAFSKKIGTSKFWLCYLPVQMAADIYHLYTLLLSEAMPLIEVGIFLAIVLPIILVAWWSTYKYHTVVSQF